MKASGKSCFLKKYFDKNTLYDRISRLDGTTLEMFAYDSSNRDDLVDFVNRGSSEKARRFIETLLPSFNVDAVWVYNSDLKLLYSTKNIADTAMKDIKIHPDFFPTLFSRSYFSHFFIKTPLGIMEIQSAPIQPASDTERKNKEPHGFIFAGRLWTDAYINDLSFLTESTIELLPISGQNII